MRTRVRTRWRVLATGMLMLAAACNRLPEPGLARGQALYNTCARCHGADGAGNRALEAPAIAGLPRWYVQAQLEGFQATHRGYAAADTTGIRMKSVSWTLDLPTDAASVAEYVASLSVQRPAALLAGDAQAGAATYQVCAACHGADGAGNEAIHAPPLTGQSDWYLHSQLVKFRAGWRGTRPEDVWGATMRPNAMMLDDAAMLNVVAYIQTLRQDRAAR